MEKASRDAFEQYRPKSQFELAAAADMAAREAARAAKAITAKKLFLSIDVREGNALPIADKLAKSSDPYFVMKIPHMTHGCAPYEKTSEVMKKTLNPVWHEKPEQVPGYDKDDVLENKYGVVTIDIFDWNKMMKHVHLGTANFRCLLSPSWMMRHPLQWKISRCSLRVLAWDRPRWLCAPTFWSCE